MQVWYYWSNNKEFGPVSKIQLFTLFKDRQIASYNFVRLEGSENWTSYKELGIRQDDFSQEELDNINATALEGIIIQPKPSPSKSIYDDSNTDDLMANQSSNWKDTSPHPWRRYLARWVDIFIYINLIIYPAAKLLGPDLINFYIDQISSLQFFIILLLGHIAFFGLVLILNTVLITVAGNTLGKFLFGVRVLDKDQQPLNLSKILKREFYVLMKGLAFGTPVIALITQIYGYLDLTMEQTTNWDKRLNTIVIHRKGNTKQLILCLFGFGFYLYFGYNFYLPYVIPI